MIHLALALASLATKPPWVATRYKNPLLRRVELRPLPPMPNQAPRCRLFVDGRATAGTTPTNAILKIAGCFGTSGFAGSAMGTESGAYTVTTDLAFAADGKAVRTFDDRLVGVSSRGRLLFLWVDEFPTSEGPSRPGKAWIVDGAVKMDVGPAESVVVGPSGEVAGAEILNSSGQNVGRWGRMPSDAKLRAFVWTNERRRALGSWVPNAIGADGSIAGFALSGTSQGKRPSLDPEQSPSEAVLWKNGQMRRLGRFGGYSAYPIGFLPNGTVVGIVWSSNPTGVKSVAHGSIWLWRDGKVERIPDRVCPNELDLLDSPHVDQWGRIIVSDGSGAEWMLSKR